MMPPAEAAMRNDAPPPNQQPAPPSASKWILAQLLINVFLFLLPARGQAARPAQGRLQHRL